MSHSLHLTSRSLKKEITRPAPEKSGTGTLKEAFNINVRTIMKRGKGGKKVGKGMKKK